MLRTLAVLVPCAAVYGFSIGASHSWRYATRNLIKFPLLILATATVCALAYWIFARFVTGRLRFQDVQGLVLRMFRDTAMLLAGLSSVSLYLALTMEQPAGRSLGEYPFFQGLNVLLIAACGSLALVHQTRSLLGEHGLGRGPGLAILFGWLALSLFVGGQCAWYLRPLFGVSSLPPVDAFLLGTTPDFRGATSFYEAVWNLVDPPRR